MQNQPHAHSSRARTYVITFVTLGILTIIEFGASNLPAFKLPALLALATTKALMVAGIYMHLKYDSRAFSTLMLMGLFCAFIMILIFTVVLSINWSQ
ncbi:MAG: cytochrome C oxidase subunit IV family protein [Chloroflexota bacterium]